MTEEEQLLLAELGALVQRLSKALSVADPKHDLPSKAMRFLLQNNLVGNFHRAVEFGPTDEEMTRLLAAIQNS